MKRIFIAFLMLLMLTPGLACAMPSCGDGKAQAAQDRPCHDEAEKGQKHHAPMSNADCAKIVLHDSADQTVKGPDLATVFAPFIVEEVRAPSFEAADAAAIRGPPPIRFRPSASDSYPPVFLTTQRIRQ